MEVFDLLNRPLRDLRISVIDQCNFRCAYCMPREHFPLDYPFLNPKSWLNFDEIAGLVGVLVGLGLKKVKLTGGEPLLRPFLPDLVEKLKKQSPSLEVDLITNGTGLSPLLGRFKDAGLDRITVSLDSLDKDQFSELSGNGQRLDVVLEAIDNALALGFNPLKINSVIIKNRNEDQIIPLVEFGSQRNCIVRFIEYMDVGSLNRWKRSDVVTGAEIIKTISSTYELSPINPSYRGETAKRFTIGHGRGEIGFINSISEPFCADCTRLRLSADGKLYTCLFAKSGHSIKGLDKTELESFVTNLWKGRSDRYSELRDKLVPIHNGRPEMFAIGG